MFDAMTRGQKTLLWAAIVLAFLIGVLLVAGSRQTATPSEDVLHPNLSLPVQPSGGSSRLPQPPRPTISETDAVKMKGKSFQPATIRVKRGALVTWSNYDLSPHTVTGSGFDSGVLSQGSVWSHQFTKSGRYEYHCGIHPQMTGVVEVR